MYDAVIVGASVAGLYAGLKLARGGRHVRIVDRRSEIGVPVRCGEATGNRAELARFVEVDEQWISSDITGLAAHVGSRFEARRKIPQAGVMLHRDRFERALARAAERAGAELTLCTEATGLSSAEDGSRGVELQDGTVLRGRVVIGADGSESMVGRLAGVTRTLALKDAFSSLQYRIRSDFCNDGLLHFFVGNEIVPHGYIWVFPKSDGCIGVGAGLYGCAPDSAKARHFLDRFVQDTIGTTPPKDRLTGCVPLAMSPRRLHRDNVAVVGDAARQANPLTAGGIMNALEAADCLGDALLNIGADRVDAALERYSAVWTRRHRNEQKIYAVLQRALVAAPDHEIIELIQAAERAFPEKIDRSGPFSLPVGALGKLAVRFGPKLVRHTPVLWA